MIQLHYSPGTASMIPHLLLEEMGVPFELVTLDRLALAHKAPAYLRINPNGLIPALTDGDLVLFYPQRWVNEGNTDGTVQVKAQAEARIGGLLDQLDGELARHGGPWVLGQTFTALDPYVFTLCRWTRNFASPPARSRPHLGPYLQRVLLRPATQRVLQTEQISAPFV
jgi:glutathione S-transferase